ncbi:hypothetical protein PG987_000363 [Apiospora arundinis]
MASDAMADFVDGMPENVGSSSIPESLLPETGDGRDMAPSVPGFNTPSMTYTPTAPYGHASSSV